MAAGQDLDVGLVARVVLCQDRAQPAVVLLVGGLPRLALPQSGVGLGHLQESAQDEVKLDRHRLFTPQRAVVVEHRQAILDRHRLSPVAAADAWDELHDRPLHRAVPPARQPVHSTRRRSVSPRHEPHRTNLRPVADHPNRVIRGLGRSARLREMAVAFSAGASRAERADRGRRTRTDVPRSSHADWEAPASRDPVALLEEQAKTRVPELVPIRYGRMLVSPFTFFRGAAYLMAADLAGAPRTGLEVELCGDAHLSNFGVFAAPDRRLVFSLNDFDETLPGPFEWDVKRLVASFAVAGRDRQFKAKQRQAINLTVVRAYR
jgi:hypothetical protein